MSSNVKVIAEPVDVRPAPLRRAAGLRVGAVPVVPPAVSIVLEWEPRVSPHRRI